MRDPRTNSHAHPPPSSALSAVQRGPKGHRNPRTVVFSLRLPEHGVLMVAVLETFYEHLAESHQHVQVQILVVLEGGLSITLKDGERIELKPGEAVAIPPRIDHRPGPAGEGRRALILDLRITDDAPSLIESCLESQDHPRRWQCDPTALAASVEQLRQLASDRQRVDLPRFMNAIWGLLITARRGEDEHAARDEDGSSDIDKRVLYLEALMHTELFRRYDAERLSQAIQVSVSQMNRLFQQHRGMTPLRRMQAIRLQEAAAFLTNSTLTIKEIAHRCGFVNPVHFTRIFRESMGMTPREFRARRSD